MRCKVGWGGTRRYEFLLICWNTEMLMDTESGKTLGDVCNWISNRTDVSKVGLPGYSGHMKYKARKKQLLCRYLLKHM